MLLSHIALRYIVTLLIFYFIEHYQSLPEDDETRKAVDNTLESLQQDDDRDVRYYSGGQVKERTFSVSDDDEGVDGRSEEAESVGGGMDSPCMQELARGLRDYNIGYTGEQQTSQHDDEDDDDDDADLVEEVYMEEHGLVVCEDDDGDDDGFEDDESSQSSKVVVPPPTTASVNAAVVEDYYADEDPAFSPSASSNDVIVVTEDNEGGENGTKTTTQQLENSENRVQKEVSETTTTAKPQQQQQESSPSDEAPIVPNNPDIKPESGVTNPESVSTPSSAATAVDEKNTKSSSSNSS